MRALVLEAEGQMPVLRDMPKPQARKGEVLVKVAASGINYADTMMRRGFYLQKPEFPFIPGFEFSGVVEQAGEGVKHVKAGDRVMGTGQATYAEYTVANALAVMPVPKPFTDEQAAAFPVTYLTAGGILRIPAHAQAGETILIHAAAGGVGTATIQLSKLLELRIIATAGTDEKLQLAARLGAEVTINYTRQDFVQPVLEATDGRGADVILESIGGDFLARDIKAAAPFARIVVFGMASGEASALDMMALWPNSVSVSAFWMMTMSKDPARAAAVTRELLWLAESSKLSPVIGGVYPFENAADALQALESRKTFGKLLLKP